MKLHLAARRRLQGGLVAVAVMLMAAGPVLADQLIVFRNGKVMRSKSVRQEGPWTFAELGKGATIGVRTTDVLRIEEAVTSGKVESEYNRASTEGRGVSREGAGAESSEAGSDQSGSIQERLEQRQQELEARRAEQEEQQPENSAVTGVGGLVPLQQPVNNRTNRGFRQSRNPQSDVRNVTGGLNTPLRGRGLQQPNQQPQGNEDEGDSDE